MAEKPNGGVYVELPGGEDGEKRAHRGCEESLCAVLRRLISAIVSPARDGAAAPLLQRIRASVAENSPLLPEASRNTARDVIVWTRRGGPLRALLVISVSLFRFISWSIDRFKDN